MAHGSLLQLLILANKVMADNFHFFTTPYPTLLLSIVDIQPPSCLGWEGVTGDCGYVSLTGTLLVLEVIFVQFISSGRCLSYIEIEDTF